MTYNPIIVGVVKRTVICPNCGVEVTAECHVYDDRDETLYVLTSIECWNCKTYIPIIFEGFGTGKITVKIRGIDDYL